MAIVIPNPWAHIPLEASAPGQLQRICAMQAIRVEMVDAPREPNQRGSVVKPIHIASSPLSNRIYAGHVLKDKRTWGSGKQDVTGLAFAAVAHCVLETGHPVTVTENGKPKYEISVRLLTQKPGEQS